MTALCVLLVISGLIFTFSMGVAGYLLGPLAIAAGGLLFWRERRRRQEITANGGTVPPRPGGQRFLIGTGATLVGVCGLFALVWRLTAPLADTAHEFFLALKAGDMQKARTYLAEDFRATTGDEELRRFVEKSALANYQSATWTTRSIHNSRGDLDGTISTESGGSIPISIDLVKEGGGWKILALRKPDAGILTDDARPQPNAADQRRLAGETTTKFADAVARQDFTQFHGSVSALWQKQVSADQLQEAFKAFSDPRIDLRRLNGEPQIESAQFDDEGVFVIAGKYPYDEANTYNFRYRYIFEALDWKVVGLQANLN